MATTPYQADLARHAKFLAQVGAHDAKATAQVIRAYDAAVADIEKAVKAQLKELKKAVDPLQSGAISQRIQILQLRLFSIEETVQASLGVAGQEFAEAIAVNAPKAYGAGLATGYEAMTGLIGQIERVNDALVTNTIARLQSGTLANAWLKNHTQTAGAAVRNSLSAGVAMGEGVDSLVRRIPLATKASKARAVTFVRTEILGAARMGNLQTYEANGIVQWRWNAAFDACMLCATRHGQVFSIMTPMGSHPSCRCSCDPVSPSVGNDPSVSEAAFIERVPPAKQLKVLGPSRYSAWSQGQVTFSGLSKKVNHPTYGPGLRATPLSELGIPKLGKADTVKLAKAPPKPPPKKLSDAGLSAATSPPKSVTAAQAAKDPPKAPFVPFEKPKPPDPLPEAPVAVPKPAPVATKVVEPPSPKVALMDYAEELGFDELPGVGSSLTDADVMKAIAHLKASGSKLKPSPTNLALAARLADEGVPFPIGPDGFIKGTTSTPDLLDVVKLYPGHAKQIVPALTDGSGKLDNAFALVQWAKASDELPSAADFLKAAKLADEFYPSKQGNETLLEYLMLNMGKDDVLDGAVDDLLDGAVDDVLDGAVDDILDDAPALKEFDPAELLEELAELKDPTLDSVLEPWVDLVLEQGPEALEDAMKAQWSASHAEALALAAPALKKVSKANGGAPVEWGSLQAKLWARFAEWGVDPLNVPVSKGLGGRFSILSASNWGDALDALNPTKPAQVKAFADLMKPPPNTTVAVWSKFARQRAEELKDADLWVKELQGIKDGLSSGTIKKVLIPDLDALVKKGKKVDDPPEGMTWTPEGEPAWKKLQKDFLISDEEATVIARVESELSKVPGIDYQDLTGKFIEAVVDYKRDLSRFVLADFKAALTKADLADRYVMRRVAQESIPATKWAWPRSTPLAVLEFIDARARDLGVDRKLVQLKLMQLRGTRARRWNAVMDDFDRLYSPKASPTPPMGNRILTRKELDELADPGDILEEMKPTPVSAGKDAELSEIVATPRNTPTAQDIGVKGELTDIGPLPGSSHGGRMVRDASGTEFIFKPATDAVISEAELAASMLGRRLSMNVPLQAPATVGGKRGLVQAMVPKSQSKGKVIPFDPAFTPNETMANQIVRHHIFDWFIGNHDTHAGNFLIGQEAKLWGVDKGQAWKFLGRDRWDPKWQAPGNHGEKVYRRFWDEVQSGKIKFTDEGWGLIDDIARMPDAEFVGIIKPYFDMLPDGQKQMAMALARKRHIRAAWTNFLSERGVKFTPPGEQVDLGMRLLRPEKKAGVKGSFIDHKNLAWQESIRGQRDMKAFTAGSYSSYQRSVSEAIREGRAPTQGVQRLQKALLSAPVSDTPTTTLRYVQNNSSHHLGDELGIPALRGATDLRDFGQYIGRAHQTDGFMSTTINPGGIGMGGAGRGYFDNKVGRVGMRLTRPAGARLTYLDSASQNSGELEALIEYGIVHRLRRVVVEGGSPSGRSEALEKLWPRDELGPRPSWLVDGGSGIKGPDGGTSGDLHIWFDMQEQLID